MPPKKGDFFRFDEHGNVSNYDPLGYYIGTSDVHHNSDVLRFEQTGNVRLPQYLADMINGLVADDEFEYRTKTDALRDALHHLVFKRYKQAGKPTDGITGWMAKVKLEQIKRTRAENTQAIAEMRSELSLTTDPLLKRQILELAKEFCNGINDIVEREDFSRVIQQHEDLMPKNWASGKVIKYVDPADEVAQAQHKARQRSMWETEQT